MSEGIHIGDALNPEHMDPEVKAMYEQLDHIADEMHKAQESGNESLLEELKAEYEDMNAKLVLILNPNKYN